MDQKKEMKNPRQISARQLAHRMGEAYLKLLQAKQQQQTGLSSTTMFTGPEQYRRDLKVNANLVASNQKRYEEAIKKLEAAI